MSVSRHGTQTQSEVQKPAYNISHSPDLATRVGSVERFGVFHADPLFVRRLQERRHAVIAIVRIRPDSANPSPAKVLDQFGQRIGLEPVAGDRPEESRVLLLIGQACTGGKVAHLMQNTTV